MPDPGPTAARLCTSAGNPTRVATGTLVPWPSCLQLPAQSHKLGQGLAKCVVGLCRLRRQCLWRAARPCPLPDRRCSCQSFPLSSAVAAAASELEQPRPTGIFYRTVEWAARPCLPVSIKQFFEVWLLGSVRPPVSPPHTQLVDRVLLLGTRVSLWQC